MYAGVNKCHVKHTALIINDNDKVLFHNLLILTIMSYFKLNAWLSPREVRWMKNLMTKNQKVLRRELRQRHFAHILCQPLLMTQPKSLQDVTIRRRTPWFVRHLWLFSESKALDGDSCQVLLFIYEVRRTDFITKHIFKGSM